MRPLLAKLLKKDRIVIRKTDSDITRMRKLTLKDKIYKEYAQNAPKNERLDEIDPLMLKNFNHDRNEIAILSPHLFKRKNYSNKLWYQLPEIRDDRKYIINNKRRAIQFLVLGLSLVGGYYLAQYLSDPEDARKYLEELVFEEQLYDHLLGWDDPE